MTYPDPLLIGAVVAAVMAVKSALDVWMGP